ncbi:MAG: hypothetical protein EOM10_12690 [Opitutae bacterium]|nr:hypothetical protein [Opitutae bacterium]
MVAPTATQQAAIAASRIVRMRQSRERMAHDPEALAVIRRNLASATAALRTFNRARKQEAL